MLVRRIIIALLAVCATVGLSARAGSGQSVATFKSAIDLVPISAVVRDGRGRLVTTLTPADFEISDNGERRRIVDFQVDKASPVTIAVLIDTSGSMRIGTKLDLARRVLGQLAAELADGRDELGLFTFDAELREAQPFTHHPAAVEAALAETQPFGSTSLYDAVAATARELERRSTARRAMLVVTDGIDTSSLRTAAEVSGLASSIDVPVYVVATAPSFDREPAGGRGIERSSTMSADLRDLATWTGGDVMWVSTGEQAALGTHHILAELHHQYLLAIESAPQSEWRSLQIHVRDRRLTVRARSGYFSQENPLSR